MHLLSFHAIFDTYIPRHSEACHDRTITQSAEEAHKKVMSREALLVCAYEDAEKFRQLRLQDAISFQDFKARVLALSKEQVIVFYCA